ncbi:MAG: DNA-3-methyladenine glycosylase family protein [Thermodesulfobacteriota bacterium]
MKLKDKDNFANNMPISPMGRRRGEVEKTEFFLTPLPPFSLNFTVWILRRRPHNYWDLWDGKIYRRVFFLRGQPLEVSVLQEGSIDNPKLKVFVTGRKINSPILVSLKSSLQQILGLEVDLTKFYEMAQNDPFLRPLVIKFWGFKPTRYPSVFEALVNAITCQQFTLDAGINLLGKLVEKWGAALDEHRAHSFPLAYDLASLAIADLRPLGFSQQKARAIIELANLVKEGLDLERFNAYTDEEVLKNLQQLRGVGRWTAEYVLLRGLGRIHIFPGDDLGIRSKLVSWLKIKEPLDYAGVMNILRKWHPFGGLVYFLLLLKGLEEKGKISPLGKN